MLSEARKRANKKWDQKALESITIQVRKGTRDAWKGYAEKMGLSLAGLIREAVESYAEKEPPQ